MIRSTSLMILTWGFLISLFLTPILADEQLEGIACRSVHLAYEAPPALHLLSSVKVRTSAPGTYFCVGGFSQGYLGIQELDHGKKVAIFSVWDPGDQDDPNAVPVEGRVKLLEKGDKVRVGRFGNEGTGGQSFLDLNWQVGITYHFLVSARSSKDRTIYSAYLATPGSDRWRLIASFSTIGKEHTINGSYAFIEDFQRDTRSAGQTRRAEFGPTWVQTVDNLRWIRITKARFTADSNPSLAIDAGNVDDHLFLATGGETKNTHIRLNKHFVVAEDEETTRQTVPDGYPTLP